MKATLTYQCDEPGSEQTMTITAEVVDEMVNVKMEFDPACGDDTSDPTGLLFAAIEAMKSFNKVGSFSGDEDDCD